jgi:hypothetical protein
MYTVVCTVRISMKKATFADFGCVPERHPNGLLTLACPVQYT